MTDLRIYERKNVWIIPPLSWGYTKEEEQSESQRVFTRYALCAYAWGIPSCASHPIALFYALNIAFWG